MKEFIIVTYSYWNYLTGKVGVGGLETYLYDLSQFINNKLGCKCVVYQAVNDKDYNDVDFGMTKVVPVYFPKNTRKSYQQLFEKAFLCHNSPDTVFVIATDQMNIKSTASNVVAIQHGISWDIPHSMIKGFWGRNTLLKRLNKYIRCFVNSRRYANSRNLVCVDYNYFNWLRTLEDISAEHNVVVIPNYCSSIITQEELNNKLARQSDVKKLLFARRFVDYRGTLVFARVCERLLKEFPSIEVTFAGAGPLESDIRELADKYDRINITSYENKDSVRFHYDYDIAVVPTIYSEGTSLSLCEAMAAGCLPVATHVGGMTNMIFDGYNGLFSSLDEEDLYNTLKKAILLSNQEREFMVRNAHEVVKNSFSIEKWEAGWEKFLSRI